MNAANILAIKTELEECYNRLGSVRMRLSGISLHTGNAVSCLEEAEGFIEESLGEIQLFVE